MSLNTEKTKDSRIATLNVCSLSRLQYYSASPAAINAMNPINGLSRSDRAPHAMPLRPRSLAAKPTRNASPTHTRNTITPTASIVFLGEKHDCKLVGLIHISNIPSQLPFSKPVYKLIFCSSSYDNASLAIRKNFPSQPVQFLSCYWPRKVELLVLLLEVGLCQRACSAESG